jgi:transposase
VICLDEMGPLSAKSFAGQRVVKPFPEGQPLPPAERARQEADYGRRGKGYVFGAFRPATGEAFTHPYSGRTTANWVDFLERTDCWLLAEAGSGETGTIYAILDNLSAHRAADVLLFSVSHPRWEFVFQPVYAAYLNLIEPWWKTLRSLALKGRRFETWEEIVQAVAAATAYWNAHRHPFVWGRRRRHQPRRKAGLAVMPTAA